MDLDAENNRVSVELRDRRLICEAKFELGDIDRLRSELLPLDRRAWSYPSLAALLTVGIGVYHYDAGDFWNSFDNLKNPADCSWWGAQFETFLALHESLETFHHLGGHRFVAPILAHGGIPQTCLPDFFSAITSHGDPDLSGQEMLKLLETHPSWVANTDKPVRRFLEHGGEVAEDFVARFLDLWCAYEEGHEEASSGLPDRVVSRFSEWYTNNKPRQRIREARFPRPELRLEPTGVGIFIYLPRCDSHPKVTHTDYWEGLGQKYAVTRIHEIKCPPIEKYELKCVDRSFALPGIDNKDSVLFFDPSTGRLITDPKHRRLPQLVWAVVRKGIDIRPTPVVIEDLPSWPAFVVAVLDLTASSSLQMANTKYQVRRPFFRAELDQEIENLRSLDELPIYAKIPAILWEGRANLSLTKDNKLQGNIDIEAPELPVLIDGIGEYAIYLRGPLGHNLQKRFVFLPGFALRVNPDVMWPGVSRITWSPSLPKFSVLSEDGSSPPFHSATNTLKFVVHSDARAFTLLGQVPVVQWRLRLSPSKPLDGFSSQPLTISVQDLKQTDYPLLECELGKLQANASVMMVAKQSALHIVEARRKQTIPQDVWYLDLRAIRDYLDRTGKPERFELVVAVQGVQRYKGTVLSVQPEWALRDFQTGWKKEDDHHSIYAKWIEEGDVVGGRWLALIPIWRPTEGATFLHELSETQRDAFEWRIPVDSLRPGRYSLRAVHAPWGSENWRQAVPRADMTVDVYPELWADTFTIREGNYNVANYVEAFLARWHRPQLVPKLEIVSEELSTEVIKQIISCLILDQGKISPSSPKRELRQLFLRNPHALSVAVHAISDIPSSWFEILPSREILDLELNDDDRAFVQEIAFQYTELRTAARHVRRKFSRRSLSMPIDNWRSDLPRELPRRDEIVFLCEKYQLFHDRRKRSAKVREYEKLKRALLDKDQR